MWTCHFDFIYFKSIVLEFAQTFRTNSWNSCKNVIAKFYCIFFVWEFRNYISNRCFSRLFWVGTIIRNRRICISDLNLDIAAFISAHKSSQKQYEGVSIFWQLSRYKHIAAPFYWFLGTAMSFLEDLYQKAWKERRIILARADILMVFNYKGFRIPFFKLFMSW